MARKDRNLAGFDDVAGDQNNANANNNSDVHVKGDEEKGRATDTIDKIRDKSKQKKEELVLIGVYLQPELAKILDRLGKEGGRGAKSSIVNDALREHFIEKGLL